MNHSVNAVVLAVVVAATAGAQEIPKFAAVQAKLTQAAEHKAAELVEFGRSAGGRPLLALRLGSSDHRAIFVGANVVGTHAAGTQAALHLVDTLLRGNGHPLLGTVTFYIAPVLNPDGYEHRRPGNDQPVDRDRDGDVGEDGVDDLDGDGRITWLRIPDAAGDWLPDPAEPRLTVKANRLDGQRGRFRLETEGHDNDGDGAYNEDGAGGVHPDRNFAHGFRYADPDSGPWASYAPESRALMDFLLARRNVALAVVYGLANNLLALPQGFDGQAPFGDSDALEVPKWLAPRLGLKPGQRITLGAAWAIAKTQPFVRKRGLTRDSLAQMMRSRPATSPAAADVAVLRELAKAYTERLKEAGQGDRPGRAYGRGGLTPWLYFHYGVLAIELDVWGVPKAKPEKKDEDDEKPADEEPDDERPEAPALERAREVLRYCAEHLPGSVAPWKKITLPDGTQAEVGGLDPLAELTPPPDRLGPALAAHTATVLDLAGKLARLDLLEVKATSLGGGVQRIEVVAGNLGYLPTHTRMAVLARSHLPIRLELELGAEQSLVSGQRWRSVERLEGIIGSLRAEWLVRGPASAPFEVKLRSQNAGSASARLKGGF